MYLCTVLRKSMPSRIKTAIFLALALLPGLKAEAQWDYSIPYPRPLHAKPDTVTVSFIGDVMMHAKQLDYDYRDFLSELGGITRDADVSVANMEFTLAGKPYTGYPAFSAPDGYAGYAAECGVDVFLTANNHILDKGSKGLKRTLKVYEAMRDSCGIHYTGSALDSGSDKEINPLVIVGRGIRIALVNFTYGTNIEAGDGWPKVMTMDKDAVSGMIATARNKEADFIVALPHWGTEYRLNHSAEQEEWAEWLVSQEVDLIVGAHPHVIQDTSHVGGVPVIYSMGNAVSNMSAENTRLELAVKARFVSHPDGSKEMLEPELEFLWCTLPGKLRDTYVTIPVRDFIGRRDEWSDPSDYDNMIITYNRVIKATNIHEEDFETGGR